MGIDHPLERVRDGGCLPSGEVGGEVTGNAKVDGRPGAYLDSCPHFGGPLERQGDKLVCGWHLAEFRLDGRCLRGPARADSRAIVLPTRIIDGVVTYTYTPPDGPGAHEDDADLARQVSGGEV